MPTVQSHTMRYGRWNAWSAIAVTGLLTLSSVAFAVWLLLRSDFAWDGLALTLPLVGLMSFSLWYAIAIASKYRVTTTEDAIEMVMVFRRHRILKSEIRGLRTGGEASGWGPVIWIEFNDVRRRPVDIYLATRKHPEVLSWFDDIPNLDGQETLQQTEAILSDDGWGRTREQRLAALVHQKRIAYALNIVGLVAAAWYWIRPQPYDLALWTNLLLPAVAVAIAAVRQDRWNYVLEAKADPKPILHTFYLLPIAALLARAVNYRIVDQLQLTILGLALGGALFALICGLIRPRRLLQWSYAALFLVTAAYGYGAATHLNARLDFRPGEQFIVKVMAAHDDRDEPEVTLSAWGPYVTARTVESGYQAGGMPEGSNAETWLYPGLFGIRWWTLGTPEPEAATSPTPP